MLRKDLVNYNSLLECLSIPVLLFNAAGVLKYQNRASRSFFNLKGLENTVKNMQDFFELNDDDHARIKEIVHLGKTSQLNTMAKHISGDMVSCQLVCHHFPLPFTDKDGILFEVNSKAKQSVANQDLSRIGHHFQGLNHKISEPIASLFTQHSTLNKEEELYFGYPDIKAAIENIKMETTTLSRLSKDIESAAEKLASEDFNAFLELCQKEDGSHH